MRRRLVPAGCSLWPPPPVNLRKQAHCVRRRTVQVGVHHCLDAFAAEHLVPQVIARTQRGACVVRAAGRTVFEAASSSSNGWQRSSAPHRPRAQILAAVSASAGARQREGLISDSLERGRDIAEPSSALLFASARPEEPFQRAQLRFELERAASTSTLPRCRTPRKSGSGIETIRIAVSCQSHDLPLAVVSKARNRRFGPEKPSEFGYRTQRVGGVDSLAAASQVWRLADPSTERTAASSKGDTKNALAA